MAIYRGPGGAGDATGDATNASALALAAKDEAQASATAAANSATAAAASATSAANDAASASSSATSAAISRTAAAASATQAESVLSTAVKLTGDQTVAGVKTFSSTIAGSINGNAATVTNGVYTTGDQTIAGTKTFSSTIAGSINGNAATVTNGVYTTGDQTIAGTKTFLSTISGSINGSASTATSATTATTATNVSGGTASVTTLTTSSTVTHNGGTANRLTYLNGSKVLSTSDILVFDGANLGLNVTPPTSVSSSGGIYLANTANIAATGPYLHFGANYYYVLTTPKYTSTAPATIYSSYNGTHLWRVAPSGTADATITWTTALTLDANADMYLPKNFYIGDASNTSSQISSGSSSNPLIFGINGTEKARIDTSGNFGLGVTPSSWGSTYAKPIQLGNKGAAVSGFTSSYSVTPYANVSVNAYFASDATWKYFDGGYGASLYQQQANEHRWSIAGTGTTGSSITFTQAMTLDASGRLLIGTTTASSMLTVAGTITSKAGGQGLSLSPSTTTNAAYMTATNGAGTSYIGIDDSAGNAFGAAYATFLIGGGARPLLLGTNGSERARIDSSGNLLVGTTTATEKVTVNGRVACQWNAYANGGTTSYSGDATSLVTGSSAGMWAARSDSALLFSIGSTEKARFDSSGNLLVGTTARGHQNSNSFDFDVSNALGYVNHISGTASSTSYFSFGYNGASIGSITQNGTTGVLYNLTSDYRLKHNPTPVTGAKEFVMALQPKTWDWWDGSGKGVGFIAHEFMEVAKYSGNGKKDAVDENGKPVYQSIQPSSSEVMANLVALIQEQQTIIESLKARLDAANL